MLLRTLAATALLCIAALAARAEPAPRFCVVPVKDAAATEQDVKQPWRSLTKVLMLPGMPHPVIYSLQRGTLTIDETRALVPFGGEFPTHFVTDRFVRDPDTGRILGVGNATGLFALDRGETQFKPLYPADGSPLKRPTSAAFVPRFKAFVVGDATGLYLLSREGALSPLPVSSRATVGTPQRIFDIPAFSALAINVQDSYIAIRFDDGQIVRGPAFEPNDTVTAVEVLEDGTLSMQGALKTYTMQIDPHPAPPIAQGQSFEIDTIVRMIRRDRVDAKSIGKSVQMQRRAGLLEMQGDTRKPIALPFDPAQEPVMSLTEMPESNVVLVFTANAIYTLDSANVVTEIPGSRSVGKTPLPHAQGIIPVRNEMIVLGANALHLVLDTRFAGEAACRAPN